MRLLPLILLSSVYAFIPSLNYNSRRDILYAPIMTTFISSSMGKIEIPQQSPPEEVSFQPLLHKGGIYGSQFNVRVVGEISEENCAQLADVLINCDNDAKQIQESENISNVISLHITSGGGALLPTLYICDLIQLIDTDVYTFVDGYAYSSASLISVCGNKRFITKHSSMLIHQLSADISGKFVEIKDKFNNADQLMNNVADIYLSKTNITLQKLAYLLQHEIMLNSTTCLELGLVDEII